MWITESTINAQICSFQTSLAFNACCSTGQLTGQFHWVSQPRFRMLGVTIIGQSHKTISPKSVYILLLERFISHIQSTEGGESSLSVSVCLCLSVRLSLSLSRTWELCGWTFSTTININASGTPLSLLSNFPRPTRNFPPQNYIVAHFQTYYWILIRRFTNKSWLWWNWC